MGAYATLGTDGSGLQRRIVEILAATGAYKAKENVGAAASAAFAMDVLEEHGKKHDYNPIGDVQVLYLMQQGRQVRVMCGQEAAEAWGKMLGCVLCSLDGEVCACTLICMGAEGKKTGQTYLEHLRDGHSTRRSACEGCLRGLMRAKKALNGALGNRRPRSSFFLDFKHQNLDF